MMTTPKFVQTQDIYVGDEYRNMPSIDHRHDNKYLTINNKSELDLPLVDKIVKKYGLDYCFITDTACRYDGSWKTRFVLYYKTDIDSDWFSDNMSYELHREQKERHKDTMLKMHDCAHELDEQTEFVFRVSRNGNIGIFGGHDVCRTTYDEADYLWEWEEVMSRYPSSITDSARQLEKGVYLMMEANRLKGPNN